MSVVPEVQEPKSPSEEPVASSPQPRRLRVWPAVVIVVLGLALQWIPSLVAPMTMAQFMALIWGPLLTQVAVLVWWLAASRASWREKIAGAVLFFGVGAASFALCDPSMGVSFMVLAVPAALTVTVLALAAGNRLSPQARHVVAVVALLVGWGSWTLLRSDGLTGAGGPELTWRWTPTAEARYLASLDKIEKAAPAESAAGEIVAQPGDWTGFRGPERDSRAPGVRIDKDWNAHPPREVWRHAIGPGWGSFAVVAGRLYTQEQRGEEEVVACYDAATGAEVWAHTDKTRFWEAMAGAGPRATPTFADGRIYALGANGLLNCLDAASGEKVWSRDAMKESNAALPMWGFSSSPLVTNGLVVVHTGGAGGEAVLAYRADTGDRAWTAAAGAFSYSSPHLAKIAGVEQILMATDEGLVSLDPASGKPLWKHDWSMPQMARIVEPHVLDGDRVLLGTGFGAGTRLLKVSRAGGEWKIDEGWTSKHLKPYFNDFVNHKGYAYGFDNDILVCVNLDDGKRTWRGRGYGNGQVLLLPDEDLLLVLAETGELALVAARPEKHEELARVPALAGKTWNHPVLVGDRLYVRNAEEVVCFELKAAGQEVATSGHQ